MKHYRPTAWSLERACRAVQRLQQLDRPAAFRVLGMHVAGLYLLRVPLLTLLVLFVFPFFAFGRGRALFENLFVELSGIAIVLTTGVTVMTAVSAVSIVNAILVNGQQRFRDLPLGKYYGGPFHLLVPLVSLPLVGNVIYRSGSSLYWSALCALTGFLVAIVLVLWIRMEQRERAERIRHDHPDWDWESRHLIYVHTLAAEEGRSTGWLDLPARTLVVLAGWLYAARVAATSWLRRWSIHAPLVEGFELATARLKRTVPLDGYLFEPPGAGPTGPRPLYSAHRYLLLLTSTLVVIWVLLFSIKAVYQPSRFPPWRSWSSRCGWGACWCQPSRSSWIRIASRCSR